MKTGEKTIEKPFARQCYYCDKYFSNISKFNSHVKCSSGIAGFIYKFEHKNVVIFQDNFSYLGDYPFVVYFNYETWTGDSVFNDKKMFLRSYCQIDAFHPDLNIDKIIIFRSFQQTEDEIYCLNQFSKEHVKYFDKVNFKQFKDSAANVLNKTKSTSLSEMFSKELKFTIDVLVKWFNDIFKSRFNELDELKKQKFIRENPIDWSNQKCVISDLKLAISLSEGYQKTEKLTTWYDFTIQKEHLFLKNIFSYDELKKPENVSTLENFYRAFDLFLHVFVLLNKYYNKNSNIEDVNHDVMKIFLETTLNSKYNSFLELCKDT